jgi:hypothetical protein
MRRLIASSVALLALTGTASAAEMTGRITFVHPDENMFILDSSSRFTLGSGVDKAALDVGLSANVTYEGSGDQLTATAVDIIEAPAAPAAPVVGAGGAAEGAAGGAAAGAGGALGGAAGGGAIAPAAPGAAGAPAAGAAPAAPGYAAPAAP